MYEAHLVKMEVHVIHFNHNVTWQSRCAEPAERNCGKIFMNMASFRLQEERFKDSERERERERERGIHLTMLALWS